MKIKVSMREIVIALTLGGVEKDSRGAVISLSRRGKIQKKKERDTATRTHFASIAALQVIKKAQKGPDQKGKAAAYTHTPGKHRS